VNLGFRDARELAKVLLDRGAQADCGDLHLLRRYERARREDIMSMQLTTDTLQQLFNNNNPLAAQCAQPWAVPYQPVCTAEKNAGAPRTQLT